MKFIKENILLSTIIGLSIYLGLVLLLVNSVTGCDYYQAPEQPKPTYAECFDQCTMECFLMESFGCDCARVCR